MFIEQLPSFRRVKPKNPLLAKQETEMLPQFTVIRDNSFILQLAAISGPIALRHTISHALPLLLYSLYTISNCMSIEIAIFISKKLKDLHI